MDVMLVSRMLYFFELIEAAELEYFLGFEPSQFISLILTNFLNPTLTFSLIH